MTCNGNSSLTRRSRRPGLACARSHRTISTRYARFNMVSAGSPELDRQACAVAFIGLWFEAWPALLRIWFHGIRCREYHHSRPFTV